MKAYEWWTRALVTLFSLSTVCTAEAQPQQKRKDSLLRELSRAKPDTNRVNLLLEVARTLDDNEWQKGLSYSNEALVLSRGMRWQNGIGRAHRSVGNFQYRLGAKDEALKNFLQSQQIAERTGDYKQEALALNNVAIWYGEEGRMAESYTARKRVVELARRHNDKPEEAEALRLLGNEYTYQNELDSALKYWLQSAELKSRVGDTSHPDLFSNIGLLYSFRNDFANAIIFYDKALDLSVKMKNAGFQAANLRQIGRMYRELRQFSQAIFYLQNARMLFLAKREMGSVAVIENNLGGIYLHLGDYDRSLKHFFAALRIGEEVDDGALLATNLNDITFAYSATGDHEKAVALLEKALQLFTQRGDTTLVPFVDMGLGNAYAAMDRRAAAKLHFDNALRTLERRGWWLQSVDALIGYATLYNNANQHPDALNVLYRALRHTTDSGEVINRSKALGGIGRAYLALSKKVGGTPLPDSLSKYSAAVLCRKAVSFLTDAITLTQSGKIINDLPEFYAMLSEARESLGDYAGALASHKSYLLYRDSLLSNEKVKAFTRRDMQHDFEKEQAAYEQQLAVAAERRRAGVRLAVMSGGSILLLLGTGFYFQRRRSADRHAAEVLALKQEALNAQMSDHFIGNTMDSINGFIVANDRQNASRYLILFSRLIRRVLENSSRKMVTVEEDLEVLRDYMALEKLRFAGDLQYEIQNPDGLDLDNILIPPMIFQTLAENAIKHGFDKAMPGRLLIVLNKRANMIECVVEDNGVGRSAAMKAKGVDGTAGRKSFGTSIAEKLISAGGKYMKDASYRVTDLLNAANQPTGTRVTFVLPLISAE